MDPSVWRIEDTRPSIVDPVDVLDAAHRSHRVTQKKRLSPLPIFQRALLFQYEQGVQKAEARGG